MVQNTAKNAQIIFSLHPIPLASSRLFPLTSVQRPTKGTSVPLTVLRVSPQLSNQQSYTVNVIASIAFGGLALIIIILLCCLPNDLIFFRAATSLNKEQRTL